MHAKDLELKGTLSAWLESVLTLSGGPIDCQSRHLVTSSGSVTIADMRMLLLKSARFQRPTTEEAERQC